MINRTSEPSYISDLEPPRKKLRVRKGTKSCWECKRRKVRCIFSVETNSVCDACERRRSTCLSQEFPDVVTQHINGDTEGRLGRVESLVENLARKIDSLNSAQRDTEDRTPDLQQPPLPSNPESEDNRQTAELRRIATELLEAWPDKSVLDQISELPLQTSFMELLFKVGGILSPNPSASSKPSLVDTMQKPPPGAHPVLIARKAVLLGLLLQDVPASCVKPLENHAIGYRDVMSRAVERTISMVTSNDQLTDSIEGIECIMMESMYHDRAGNLRRSWSTTRRAMTMAQLMGLHRGKQAKTCLNTLSSNTEANIDPEYLWSRIVQSDRYLSLVLGLPQGSSDNSFATPKVLEKCTPAEQLRRLHCVAAGYILQRNDINDISATREIDDLLQKASAFMPPRWWLTPDFAPRTAEDDLEAPDKTLRLMSQAVHYHLLAQLHLPYLLRPASDLSCNYSRITAVTASREVITRFLTFRKGNPVSSYCHGIDFLAFIASTAMCIAHLDSHRQKVQRVLGFDALDFLAHQRQGDRGMLEATLEAMERMSVDGEDAIAKRIAILLRHLLFIESEAAAGVVCSYRSQSEQQAEEAEELGCGGTTTDGDNILRIHIPYLGGIVIRRGSDMPEGLACAFGEDGQPFELGSVESWGLQGVDTAFFDNLLRGAGESESAVFEQP
ncbi:hypothetical protein QC762_609050 [Podospora pseudocomata]|uniref:Zn(2)-C6 fungal-type domain-containing protein n=1 Tax=Podospora pseudocomata TaxID=2093779 RepID=A0ABR0G921_9PEZI|nr:hypothetical protein QC762_609050 [Podospora pseudocomata]